MRGYPGVSRFVVPHRLTRRGPYKGWSIKYVYYKARLMRQGRVFFLGHFDTPEAAAAAYRKAKGKKIPRSRGTVGGKTGGIAPPDPI
jgi:hypothetical protein